MQTHNVMFVENFALGEPVNQSSSPFSEVPTADKTCPLCKRFPIRFEHDDPRGGKISVCTRCEHHVTEYGFDDDFFWGLQHITNGHGLNLRFEKLSSYRK